MVIEKNCCRLLAVSLDIRLLFRPDFLNELFTGLIF